MRIPPKIIDKAFDIGFTYMSKSFGNDLLVTLPCSITLKTGEIFEQAELILIDKLFRDSDYTVFQIEDIESISVSKYALSQELRMASINTPEYLHDRPFYILTNRNNILGFNAFEPVNFTYKSDVLGEDIIRNVDHDYAQSEGFEFIKDHSRLSVKIICGYDIRTIDRIRTVYNIK